MLHRWRGWGRGGGVEGAVTGGGRPWTVGEGEEGGDGEGGGTGALGGGTAGAGWSGGAGRGRSVGGEVAILRLTADLLIGVVSHHIDLLLRLPIRGILLPELLQRYLDTLKGEFALLPLQLLLDPLLFAVFLPPGQLIRRDRLT